MTDHTPAPAMLEAALANPLSDEHVNAVIQRHGCYRSPETVIARLNQWIGLHGGEDSVTLLMYEAHKALSKLHADAVPNAQPAFWIDLEPISGSQNLLIRQWQNLGALGPGKHTLFLSPAADQASAPVADDLVHRLRGKYAMGPMIDGEPEFGWRDCSGPAPEGMRLPSPIMLEAAAAIERLSAQLRECAETLGADHIDEQRAMQAYADAMALLGELPCL